MPPPGWHCSVRCSNACQTDGKCHDGGTGTHAGLRPACAYGADCKDCGPRTVCTHEKGGISVPREAVSNRQLPLSLGEILFLVMGSDAMRHRSLKTHRSWCGRPGVRCLFLLDSADPEAANAVETQAQQVDAAGASSLPDNLPVVRVAASLPPTHCCRNAKAARRSQARVDFFCRHHRASTLAAQYRFLPALLHVRASAAFQRRDFRWVIIVDDDSYVFTENTRKLLELLDDTRPLYLGDFASSSEAFARSHVSDFACGGGGSVLSVAALRRMNVRHCIADYHPRCMQSDWMIGGCAASHNVSFVRQLGCSTCDMKTLNASNVQRSLNKDACFFAQNFPTGLRLGSKSPAVIHGIGAGTGGKLAQAAVSVAAAATSALAAAANDDDGGAVSRLGGSRPQSGALRPGKSKSRRRSSRRERIQAK